ncbi:MAG TPA: protein phosphatase 2C domain-containing protein, partial [Thermoanaerobaculia bacterium]|nr:protein phosphatase 2C domain-containing protein [Thermoanaerobaculia bacterium]
PSSPALRIGAGAHRGKVREENQDRISRFRCPAGEVFVVADGVGGYQGGAEAAEIVINGLESHLSELPAGTPVADALREAARRTSADVHRRAQSGDPATANMGATGVLVLIAGHLAYVGHAGDSRAYLLRGGELVRLTRDHTRVQQMLERNLLSEEEAREHPDASIVTRAFGKDPDLDLEVAAPFELCEGDLLLLASDGLCGYVDDERIQAALLAGGDAQETADRLIGLALDAGGQDNVSVQVIAVPAAVAAPAVAAAPLPAAGLPAAAAPGGRRRPLAWVAVAILLVFAFLAGLLLPWDRWIGAGIDWWRTEAPKESGDKKKTDKKKQQPPAPRSTPKPPQRRERKPPGQVTVHVLVQTTEDIDGRGTETL